MKFRIILLIFILSSCATNSYKNKDLNFIPYSSKGFAIIYTENDFKNKIITRKFDSNVLEVGHNKLPKNSIVTITNPDNKKSLTLKVSKKVKYPNFYSILITEKIANILQLDKEMPFIDVQQKFKNKSFVAKKAITHSEEQIVSDKAPVTKVKIDNISLSKNNAKKPRKFSIIIGNFYSIDSANNLIKILETDYLKKDVLKVKKLTDTSFQLYSGPYISINTLKNDYFKLNKYGFENLDLKKHE